jgi:site-specific DNA-methyltransferase (adenine-specific)
MCLIYNEDCISGAKKLADQSVDLLICDPPFGIQETKLGKHYNRNKQYVIGGYVEAPPNYYQFTLNWLTEAVRVLKDNGSLYIFSGWTNLRDVLNAVASLNLYTINHIIWKYNFGVYTKKKYVTSHYHIIYIKKYKNSKVKFNTFCRYGAKDRSESGGSLNYRDREDVFLINREYQPGQQKNENKLPSYLVEKLIEYSSDVGDVVGDFFLGNFTTAIAAKKLGRKPVGFEINSNHFAEHLAKLDVT